MRWSQVVQLAKPHSISPARRGRLWIWCCRNVLTDKGFQGVAVVVKSLDHSSKICFFPYVTKRSGSDESHFVFGSRPLLSIIRTSRGDCSARSAEENVPTMGAEGRGEAITCVMTIPFHPGGEKKHRTSQESFTTLWRVWSHWIDWANLSTRKHSKEMLSLKWRFQPEHRPSKGSTWLWFVKQVP